MAIPGVANVAIWGQRDRQLQVLIDPDRLRAHGITVEQVVQAAGEGVSLQAGGFLDTPNQRLAITHAAAVGSGKDLESMETFAHPDRAAIKASELDTGNHPTLQVVETQDEIAWLGVRDAFRTWFVQNAA